MHTCRVMDVREKAEHARDSTEIFITFKDTVKSLQRRIGRDRREAGFRSDLASY